MKKVRNNNHTLIYQILLDFPSECIPKGMWMGESHGKKYFLIITMGIAPKF